MVTKKNKTGIIGVIITSIILISLIIFSNIKEEKFFLIENSIAKIVVPIQNGLTLLKNKLENNTGFFVKLNEIESENERLKEENNLLKQKINEIDILRAENNNYKNYLKIFTEYSDYELVPAYIINDDIFNYTYNIVINVGKDNGVDVGMAVVNEDGIVGHVISVTDNTSKIKTLVDTSCFVSASINDINNSVVCNGLLNNREEIKATFIEPEQIIVEGDLVQTNGLGGIYPKGLKIGTVKEVVDTQNITDRYIIIKTSVNFNNLNYLMVIKNK